MTKKKKKSLDSIYEFMADAYRGNWTYRWNGVPYMQKRIKSGQQESILAHQWACIGFWFLMREVCPNLAKLVNTQEIYERVWSHDLGETFLGDISQYRQVNGEGDGKHVLEYEEVMRMAKNLPKKTKKDLSNYVKNYGHNLEKVTKLEVLVAKLIDTIQGNHFSLVFAQGLGDKKYKLTVAKIVERTSVKAARQILKILKQKGRKAAYQEVLDFINHHLAYYKAKGVPISYIK